MYWKYPQLIHLIEFRTIESVTPICIYEKNKKTNVGYIIESTTGLITDKTLCIYKFSKEYLKNNNLINLLKKNNERTCIIDTYSDSWGKKKVVIGRQVLIEWINEFLEEDKLNNPIFIENSLDFRLKINVKIR